MKSLRGVAKLVVAIWVTLAEGAACTIVYPLIAVGPSFQVRVNDRGRPVYGLRIKLTGRNYTKTVTTSREGTARFRGLAPGTYEVGAEFDGGMRDAAVVDVKTTGPGDIAIPLQWPQPEPLSLRTLKGVLRWPTTAPNPHAGRLQVTLLDARTGKSQLSTQTTGDGGFDLGTPMPGMYFLRVEPIDQPLAGAGDGVGLIPVEVDPRAVHLEMDLEFGFTSCGFFYAVRHTCSRQELNLANLSGQVVDSSGAPIGRATVRLLRGDGEVAEEVMSDERGQVVSPKRLEGSYELVVSAPGFTSLRQPVRATRADDAGGHSALRIELGVMGACSQAAVR